MATFVNSAPIAVSSSVVNNPAKNYSKTFQTLGILQILLGTLSIITWSYALAFAVSGYYYDVFAYISAGIWCGIFFLVAGILAAVSSVEPNNCKIISGMVMSIFAAIFAATMLGIEVAGAVLVPFTASRYNYYSYCSGYYQPSYYKSGTHVSSCYSSSAYGSSTYRPSQYISSVYIPSKYIPCYNSPRISSGSIGMSTLHGFMAFFAFAELIVAIVHSVYCCKYKNLTRTGAVYTTTYQQPMTQQMPVTSIGQHGGMPMTTTYPAVLSVPYQYPTPIYANHQANMMNPPNATSASMTSPTSTAAPPLVTSSDMTSPPPPQYTEADGMDNKLI